MFKKQVVEYITSKGNRMFAINITAYRVTLYMSGSIALVGYPDEETYKHMLQFIRRYEDEHKP